MSELYAWIQLSSMIAIFVLGAIPGYFIGKKIGSYIGLAISVLIYFAKGGKVHGERKGGK